MDSKENSCEVILKGLQLDFDLIIGEDRYTTTVLSIIDQYGTEAVLTKLGVFVYLVIPFNRCPKE